MSEILDRWRAGEGFPDTLVIDGHTHVGEWPHGANFASVDEMAAGGVAVMDANGVDAACVMSGGYMACGTDFTLGNDILIELARRLPERIIPFAHFNPNAGSKAVLEDLERVYAAGIRCIKLLNSYQNYAGDGPTLMDLYAFADEHNMLILNHAWTNEEIVKITAQFPNTDFILGHYNWADELIRKTPNLYVNLWSLGVMGFIERPIRAMGPEKILFGSDAFMNPISVGIGMVVYADVPDEHKRMILGGTQARLLDKVGALPAAIKERYGLP